MLYLNKVIIGKSKVINYSLNLNHLIILTENLIYFTAYTAILVCLALYREPFKYTIEYKMQYKVMEILVILYIKMSQARIYICSHFNVF